MSRVLRFLFFALIVKPLALVVIGLNIRRRELLPKQGPALIVANHNSHLDTLTLISLFPLRMLPKLRPVAAADFFLKNRLLAWFSMSVIGIIPLQRSMKGVRTDPLAGMIEALDRDEILILFPEGSRGQPEELEEFKTGIAHIAKRRTDVPFTPVFMHGLGKSLPRGEGVFVPFFADIFIGEAIRWTGDRQSFMDLLNERMTNLADKGNFPEWD